MGSSRSSCFNRLSPDCCIHRCVASGMQTLRKLRRASQSCSCSASSAPSRPPPRRPRGRTSSFLVVDDWDWSSWPSRGAYARLLPNIDANFVRSGLSLSRHYTFFTCAPSRQSLLSGRLPIHVNEQNVGCGGVPLQMATLANMLQRANYATHFIGKYHAGFATNASTPTRRGFDSALGFYLSEHHHTSHCSHHSGACRALRDPRRQPASNATSELPQPPRVELDFFDGVAGDGGAPRALGAAHPAAVRRTFSTTLYAERALDIVRRHPAAPLPLLGFVGAARAAARSRRARGAGARGARGEARRVARAIPGDAGGCRRRRWPAGRDAARAANVCIVAARLLVRQWRRRGGRRRVKPPASRRQIRRVGGRRPHRRRARRRLPPPLPHEAASRRHLYTSLTFGRPCSARRRGSRRCTARAGVSTGSMWDAMMRRWQWRTKGCSCCHPLRSSVLDAGGVAHKLLVGQQCGGVALGAWNALLLSRRRRTSPRAHASSVETAALRRGCRPVGTA